MSFAHVLPAVAVLILTLGVVAAIVRLVPRGATFHVAIGAVVVLFALTVSAANGDEALLAMVLVLASLAR